MSRPRRDVAVRPVRRSQWRWLVLLVAVAFVVALGAALIARAVEDRLSYADPFDRWPPVEVAPSGTAVDGAPALDQDLARFLGFVTTDVQRFWAQQLGRAGAFPVPPRPRGALPRRRRTGCGTRLLGGRARSTARRQTVYLDLTFFDELRVASARPATSRRRT